MEDAGARCGAAGRGRSLSFDREKEYGQPVVELVKCCGVGAREDTSSRGERK